jgi:hypothetical protein
MTTLPAPFATAIARVTLTANMLAIVALLAFVAQKDAVHTGIEPRWLAAPFLIVLIAACWTHRTQPSRIARLAIVTSLASGTLPIYLHWQQHLMSYGAWISAGMPEPRSVGPAFAIFFLAYGALALAVGLRPASR